MSSLPSPGAEAPEGLRDRVLEWCKERSWIARAPLLAFMAYVSIRHIADRDYSSLLGGLNLGIHEGGHLLFGFLGSEFLMVAGGTLLQLAAPVVSAWLFLRQPDYFATAFCGTWFATNLYNVATYVGDAREMDLPLVSVGGGEVVHDWNFMLSSLHLLAWDTSLAALIRLAAFFVAWGAILAGGWMLFAMARSEG